MSRRIRLTIEEVLPSTTIKAERYIPTGQWLEDRYVLLTCEVSEEIWYKIRAAAIEAMK